MLKLIGIIVAAMPVVLFVRAILMGSKQRTRAVSGFRKQVDDAVSVILVVIGIAVVISIGTLLYGLITAAPP
jgi:hypothetical protein